MINGLLCFVSLVDGIKHSPTHHRKGTPGGHGSQETYLHRRIRKAKVKPAKTCQGFKTWAVLNKSEAVELVEMTISSPVAPRDHFLDDVS